MSTQALTLTGLQHAQLDLGTKSVEVRDALLVKSRRVAGVADAMDAEEATDVLRGLKTLVKEIEETRKIVKDPVLELGKKIDETAKSFICDVKREIDRLDPMLGGFLAAEQSKADAARRAAQEEANRLAADAARAQIAAARATSATEVERSQQAAVEAETKAIEAAVAVAEIAPVKPDGAGVRKNWKFEVTDINALYTARPDLCIIEPNNAGIRAQIPHNQNIPGLRIWQEVKASIR